MCSVVQSVLQAYNSFAVLLYQYYYNEYQLLSQNQALDMVLRGHLQSAYLQTLPKYSSLCSENMQASGTEHLSFQRIYPDPVKKYFKYSVGKPQACNSLIKNINIHESFLRQIKKVGFPTQKPRYTRLSKSSNHFVFSVTISLEKQTDRTDRTN